MPDMAQSVLKMAKLSKLELTAAESEAFAAQLDDILDYVAQLKEADVTGVVPMVHPIELPTALREDAVVASSLGPEGKPRVLESAPETLHDGYKVPPIL